VSLAKRMKLDGDGLMRELVYMVRRPHWLAGWLSVYDLRKQSDKTTFVTHLLEHVPEGR
jgi:hypothetical protein